MERYPSITAPASLSPFSARLRTAPKLYIRLPLYSWSGERRLSKEKKRSIKDILDQLVNTDMPDLMKQIIDEPKVEADVKAARVGLANTVMHHLKILAAAYE